MAKVIVSLTSFPGAAEYAAGAVRSILDGTVKPDRIVLYLTMSRFPDGKIPESLSKLRDENLIFEIRDHEPDIRSYQKLVPALRDFPDDIIVTIDDDVKYHPRMLEKLLHFHSLHPHAIIAHRAKMIHPDKPYRKWKKYRWYHFLFKRNRAGLANLQTGVGGVLYPPGALRPEMIDESLFSRLAPTADDIWFWAAAAANDTKVFPVPFGYNKMKGLGKPKSLSLKLTNFKSGVDRNKAMFDAIVKEFPDLKNRLTHKD